LRRFWIDENKVNLLIQYSLGKHADLPNVPRSWTSPGPTSSAPSSPSSQQGRDRHRGVRSHRESTLLKRHRGGEFDIIYGNLPNDQIGWLKQNMPIFP
jgi:hypothetical protein